LKKEQNKLPEEKEEKKQSGEVSRRDFLVGAGTVVVGGAIGAGVLSSCGENTVTETVIHTTTKPVTTIITTTEHVGEGEIVTVTASGREGTVTETVTTGIEQEEGEEKSGVLNLGLCGSSSAGANAARIDVKNGKIVRIRPLHYDEQYSKEDFNYDIWKFEVNGKTFRPTLKSLLPPHSLGYKKRVYSPNRVRYPLKRVDWDPAADPATGRNTENRGKSKFERISWDEATNIIASEINRIQETYGSAAICAIGSGHGESKCVHAAHGGNYLLLNLTGGYTRLKRGADSWEGWYWGAKHAWGMDGDQGKMVPVTNCFWDVSQNTEMLLYWGCDAETTPWGWSGQMASRLMYWFTEIGKKSVFISPDLNYSAAVHADKWIPVLPNTDTALHMAISYTWITEETYDADYVSTHTVGFDAYKSYIVGDEDGIPKTPEWASKRCGVSEWTIKALARAWASKVTSTVHCNGGSYIRGPYSSEPARFEVLNLAMQGVGNPGRHQLPMLEWGIFGDSCNPLPGSVTSYSFGTADRCRSFLQSSTQAIPETMLYQAIFNPPISWYGSIAEVRTDQFNKYTYPVDEEEGGTDIHMYWTDQPCNIGCWNGSSHHEKAYRSSQLEFILAQEPWLENDCLYADIVLPVCTKFELNDLGVDVFSGQFKVLIPENKLIEPVGESKSDYEIICAIAEKLDKYGGRYENIYQKLTEGKSVDEWIQYGFETSGLQNVIGWEEFNQKGYYVVPANPDWMNQRAGMIDFVEDPEGNPLDTQTGLIEFESRGLKDNFPDDEERPPVPHWVTGGPEEDGWYHNESLESDRAKSYPLLIVSNHPRWRVHVQLDDVPWLREIPTCKVTGPDGYKYEPVWINPKDAESRGIVTGDIVRIYNERGSVLGGAIVMERIIPGAIYQDHGPKLDEIVPGELDRGGSNNLISPLNILSRNATGQATSGFLVEVEKVSGEQMDEWRANYPDAFNRDYHPDYGPIFTGWIKGDTD
jgi:anaerobic selenocysteine-containing dehydrogenase